MSGLPTYEYRPPHFEGSDQKCRLQTFNETRARGFLGGTFFRSIEIGKHTNDISIEAVEDVPNDRFTVTVILNDISEVYNINRIQEDEAAELPAGWLEGDPIPDPIEHLGGDIGQLRAQINAVSTLITMPDRDYDINDIGGEDDFVLSEFSANLTNGNGAEDPQTHTPTYRTGYHFSLCYINQSEITQDNGTLVNVFQTREWDGNQWKPYSPS